MSFSKKIENFWYHYKLHTILGLSLVFLIAAGIVQCSSRVEYDMSLVYAGSHYLPTEKAVEALCEIVPDINGDGRVNVYFDTIVIPDTPQTEADFRMLDKLSIAFIDGSTRIFIMDKDFFMVENYAEMFKPLEGIVDKKYLDNAFEFKGSTIAVSSTDCPFLVNNGLAHENLYVGILGINKIDEGKKDIEKIYKASEEILKGFLNAA